MLLHTCLVYLNFILFALTIQVSRLSQEFKTSHLAAELLTVFFQLLTMLTHVTLNLVELFFSRFPFTPIDGHTHFSCDLVINSINKMEMCL